MKYDGVVAFGKHDNLLYLAGLHNGYTCRSCCGLVRWESSVQPLLDELETAVAFQGNAYLADNKGTVAVLKDLPNSMPVVIVPGYWDQDVNGLTTYLVNNVDQLLLV